MDARLPYDDTESAQMMRLMSSLMEEFEGSPEEQMAIFDESMAGALELISDDAAREKILDDQRRLDAARRSANRLASKIDQNQASPAEAIEWFRTTDPLGTQMLSRNTAQLLSSPQSEAQSLPKKRKEADRFNRAAGSVLTAIETPNNGYGLAGPFERAATRVDGFGDSAVKLGLARDVDRLISADDGLPTTPETCEAINYAAEMIRVGYLLGRAENDNVKDYAVRSIASFSEGRLSTRALYNKLSLALFDLSLAHASDIVDKQPEALEFGLDSLKHLLNSDLEQVLSAQRSINIAGTLDRIMKRAGIEVDADMHESFQIIRTQYLRQADSHRGRGFHPMSDNTQPVEDQMIESARLSLIDYISLLRGLYTPERAERYQASGAGNPRGLLHEAIWLMDCYMYQLTRGEFVAWVVPALQSQDAPITGKVKKSRGLDFAVRGVNRGYPIDVQLASSLKAGKKKKIHDAIEPRFEDDFPDMDNEYLQEKFDTYVAVLSGAEPVKNRAAECMPFILGTVRDFFTDHQEALGSTTSRTKSMVSPEAVALTLLNSLGTGYRNGYASSKTRSGRGLGQMAQPIHQGRVTKSPRQRLGDLLRDADNW